MKCSNPKVQLTFWINTFWITVKVPQLSFLDTSGPSSLVHTSSSERFIFVSGEISLSHTPHSPHSAWSQFQQHGLFTSLKKNKTGQSRILSWNRYRTYRKSFLYLSLHIFHQALLSSVKLDNNSLLKPECKNCSSHMGDALDLLLTGACKGLKCFWGTFSLVLEGLKVKYYESIVQIPKWT